MYKYCLGLKEFHLLITSWKMPFLLSKTSIPKITLLSEGNPTSLSNKHELQDQVLSTRHGNTTASLVKLSTINYDNQQLLIKKPTYPSPTCKITGEHFSSCPSLKKILHLLLCTIKPKSHTNL